DAGQHPGGREHHSRGGFGDLDRREQAGEGERATQTQLGEFILGGLSAALPRYRLGHDSTFRVTLLTPDRYPRGISRSRAAQIRRIAANLESWLFLRELIAN